MTQDTQQPQGKKSHFDAAKEIVEALQNLDKASQSLAIRFAAETLELQLPSFTQTAPNPLMTPSAQPLLPASSGTPDSMILSSLPLRRHRKVISSSLQSSPTITASKHQRQNEKTQ